MPKILDYNTLWVNKIIYNQLSFESFTRLTFHSFKILKHDLKSILIFSIYISEKSCFLEEPDLMYYFTLESKEITLISHCLRLGNELLC